MESPPRPKRFVGTIDNLSSLPKPIHVDHLSDNLTLMQAKKQQSGSCSSMAFQCVATSPELVKESEAPNLCAFVNEVVVQQQHQIDQFEARKQILASKIQQLNSLKEIRASLVEESKSIKRRSFLASEESIKQRSKITKLRDEILALLAEERLYQKRLEVAKSHNFHSFAENGQKKMRFHEEKVKTNGCNSELNEEISNCKATISEYNSQIEKITVTLNSSNSPNEIELPQENMQLTTEKDKLLLILQRKKEALRDEEEKIKTYAVHIDNSKKRVAAQKLRLRNRIAEKKRLMQRFEEEAAVLQIEMDDISSNC